MSAAVKLRAELVPSDVCDSAVAVIAAMFFLSVILISSRLNLFIQTHTDRHTRPQTHSHKHT